MPYTHDHAEPATGHDAHAHTYTAGQSLLWVAIIFASFGTLEIVVSAIIGHAAATVFADGIHNLIDALELFSVAKIEQVLVRANRPLSEFGRKLLIIAIGAAGPLSYGLSLLAWSAGKTAPLSARETIIILAFGGASYWINKRCHLSTADHNHAGLSAHLLADMAGAAAVVLTTVVVALDMSVSAGLATFIAISAFNVMAYLTWKELSPTVASLAADIAKRATSWLSALWSPEQTEPVPLPLQDAIGNSLGTHSSQPLMASGGV